MSVLVIKILSVLYTLRLRNLLWSSEKSFKKIVTHRKYLCYSPFTGLKFKPADLSVFTSLHIPLKLMRLNAVCVVKCMYKVFIMSKTCLFFFLDYSHFLERGTFKQGIVGWLLLFFSFVRRFKTNISQNHRMV